MNKLRKIDFEERKLVYFTPPHAPVLVSTISPFGNYNLAVFEQFILCSNTPPRVCIIITTETDTYKNIMDGSDFCIGIPNEDILVQLYNSGERLPRDKSEFDTTKLVAEKSFKTKSPLIKECNINLECVLNSELDGGDHRIIIGDVVYGSIKEEEFKNDKISQRLGINSPYYVTSGYFFMPGKVVKINKTW